MSELDRINAELSQIESVLGQTSSGLQDTSSIDTELARIDQELRSRTASASNLPVEWKNVPLQALKNIPRSSLEFGKNIWNAVSHPVRTMDSIESIVKGGIEKLIPGEQKDEQLFDSAVSFFKDRYGSVEGLKQTITTDPVGFLSDVSVIAGGGGAAISTAGKVSKVGSLSKTGQILSKGVMADPLTAMGKGASRIATKETPRLARSFAKTALKPTAKARFSEVEKLNKIDTMADMLINQGRGVNRRSIAGLGDDIKAVQAKIKGIIDKGDDAGVQIRTKDVVDTLDELSSELNNLGIKSKDINRNLKAIKEFKEEALKNSPEFLTPSQAQRFKLFRNKKYLPNTELAKDAIEKVINNKLRATTKTMLEAQFPPLKELNSKQGVMLELQQAIAKRIKTLESAPLGTPGLVAGGGGALAGGLVSGSFGGSLAQNVAAATAFGVGSVVVSRAITSPAIQLIIARALNSANIKLAKAGKLGNFTQPAFQVGRISREAIKEEQ